MANLAAANVTHRKTRTAVSVLAVAMEVAMVMVLVGMAEGTLGEIASRLENVGADVLFQPPDASFILGATSAVMPVRYIEIMKRDVPEVVEATPVLNWLVAKIKDDSRAVNLWAIDYPSFKAISGGFSLVEGRALEKPYDLVMDTVLANATGTRLGDRLPMMNREFRVTGHLPRRSRGPALRPHRGRAGRRGHAGQGLVLPGQGAIGARTRKRWRRALQERFKGLQDHARGPGFPGHAGQHGGPAPVQGSLTAMAVVVSFLVVLLAMYTTIIERTREIGILRAIGASQQKVVRLVVEESAWICVAGVVVGIGLAVACRSLLPLVFPTLSISLTREWALIASSLGLLGGLIGSIYPAIKAARLDPVQALNFE